VIAVKAERFRNNDAKSELALTIVVIAVATELHGLTGALARSATIFSAFLRRARTTRILADIFFSHDFSLDETTNLVTTRA